MRAVACLTSLCVVAFACAEPPAQPLPADEAVAAPPSQSEAPVPEPAAPDEQVVSPLMAGEHTVCGVRMPNGMIPMDMPSKDVHRFEGTHAMSSVKSFLTDQLEAPVNISPNRFSAGFFIESARPAGATADATRCNFKINEGSLGGARVDVWPAGVEVVTTHQTGLETYESSLQRRRAVAGASADAPVVRYETKQEKVKATFRVIDKMARGEPLTEEDYQSPYFTDL